MAISEISSRSAARLAPAAPKVLVVDDSLLDRRLAGELLHRQGGLESVYAEGGREALAVFTDARPDVVVTDLRMPDMDGFELVAAIRKSDRPVPVVLMTSHGSERIAVRALREGAASYVPKLDLARELVATVRGVLDLARGELGQRRVLERLRVATAQFELENDVSMVPPLVHFLDAALAARKIFDATGRIQLGVAMREAIVNAIHHGNLEIPSDLREGDGGRFESLVAERRARPPFSQRRVGVRVHHRFDRVCYRVIDEGPGFDPGGVVDPTGEGDGVRVGGRGLLLIRTFMDRVSFNPRGNAITMVKYVA